MTFIQGHTGLLIEDEFADVTQKGNFSWATLHVKRGGTCQFQQITAEMFIHTAEFKVKYEGLLYMNDAVISSGNAWVESEGIFHFDARGEPAETGDGAGITSGGYGYGAAHGG